MSRRMWAGLSLAVAAFLLTGCTAEQQIQERAKAVKACVDSGGEWYNTPGWGESCKFDTRSKP